MFRSAKTIVISLCSVVALGTSAFAQAVDQAADQNATADPAPLTQNAPVAENDAAAPQPAEAPPPNLGQGTKAQAEHSAEATAHKSLNDPNNQLGTSLQGRTRPIVDANGSQTTASADTPAVVTPPEAGAQ